jgi:hypothetical protein
LIPPSDVILGVTHVRVGGELIRLLTCPFCSFQNIHQDTITHHIRYTDDADHDVDIDHLDKGCYIVTIQRKAESPWGPYVRTEDLPLPWTRCLWCDYRDKIDFDLSLHILELHREKVLQLPIYSSHRKRTKALSGDFFARFEGAIEFRLDVAVEMAKEQNRGKGVRHAVRILQRRAVERRKHRKQRDGDITVHYQRLAEIIDIKPKLVRNGECDNPKCVCHRVDAMKDPESAAQWDKQKYEWLSRWPPNITSPTDRYVPCKECHKPIVKNETGICDNCYWLDIFWNKGGVRVGPQNLGE